MPIVPMTHGTAHQINIDLLLQSYYSLVENQKAAYVSASFLRLHSLFLNNPLYKSYSWPKKYLIIMKEIMSTIIDPHSKQNCIPYY